MFKQQGTHARHKTVARQVSRRTAALIAIMATLMVGTVLAIGAKADDDTGGSGASDSTASGISNGSAFVTWAYSDVGDLGVYDHLTINCIERPILRE